MHGLRNTRLAKIDQTTRATATDNNTTVVVMHATSICFLQSNKTVTAFKRCSCPAAPVALATPGNDAALVC